MRAALGRVANIKSFPSMGIARLEIEVPIESYVDVVGMLFGQDALVTVAGPDLKDQLGRYGVHDAGEGDPPSPDDLPQTPPADAPVDASGLTKLSGILCKNPAFWRFLNVFDVAYWKSGAKCSDEADAARYVRYYCHIDSRRELDTNIEAAADFHVLRRAWLDWSGQ